MLSFGIQTISAYSAAAAAATAALIIAIAVVIDDKNFFRRRRHEGGENGGRLLAFGRLAAQRRRWRPRRVPVGDREIATVFNGPIIRRVDEEIGARAACECRRRLRLRCVGQLAEHVVVDGVQSAAYSGGGRRHAGRRVACRPNRGDRRLNARRRSRRLIVARRACAVGERSDGEALAVCRALSARAERSVRRCRRGSRSLLLARSLKLGL